MNFSFEQLEERVLLAASVSQSGTTLTINGSNAADDVTIETTATGDVTVTDNTTGDSFDFTGVVNIVVNGKNGNDLITVGELDLGGGRITINGGNGNDEAVFIGDVTARVVINGNNGNDVIDFDGISVFDNVQIKAGSGNDLVDMDGSFFGGNVGIDMENGNDNVTYDNVEIDGYFHLKLGAGNDSTLGAGSTFHGTVHIEGGAGDDVINHDAFFGGNQYDGILEIDGDGGKDQYFEIDANVDGKFNADGGPGNDFNDLSGSTFNGGFKLQNF
jgi:hypothetical protein